MKLWLAAVAALLIVAFVADGAFTAGKALKQKHEAAMRKLT